MLWSRVGRPLRLHTLMIPLVLTRQPAQRHHLLTQLIEFIASIRHEDPLLPVWTSCGSLSDAIQLRSIIGGGGPMLALAEYIVVPILISAQDSVADL